MSNVITQQLKHKKQNWRTRKRARHSTKWMCEVQIKWTKVTQEAILHFPTAIIPLHNFHTTFSVSSSYLQLRRMFFISIRFLFVSSTTHKKLVLLLLPLCILGHHGAIEIGFIIIIINSLSVLTAIFQVNRLAGVYWSKGWWRWWWQLDL